MKIERGYRLKANHFSSWSRPMKVISDVTVSRNWYKTKIRFQIGYIFAEYDLLKPTISIRNCIYEFSYKFYTVLYQFLETVTSDITFVGRDHELKWLAFSLYPFHFSFTVPLTGILNRTLQSLSSGRVIWNLTYSPFNLKHPI